MAALDGLKFINDTFPDWIILFGLRAYPKGVLDYFAGDQHTYHCSRSSEKCRNTRLNIFFEDWTRPELPWHHFGPLGGFDPWGETIHIFKRMKKDRPGEPIPEY